MASFIGGIHPPYNKITQKNKIEVAKLPKKVILPLRQHTGSPCEPLVKPGDYVRAGQKIADSDAFVSAPIHASISGTVREIADKPHPVLGSCKAIVIESDGKIDWYSSAQEKEIDYNSENELKKVIKEAGIVGLGGAAFPTHVKLSPPEDKKIDTVILNGAECEPYLTCDQRLMLEKTEEILKGFLIIKKILNAKKAIIGIEDNKENAANFLKEKIIEKNFQVEVVILPTKYPQGSEKQLIYAITKRKVPPRKLPLDVGIVVQNVQTAKAVYDAVVENKPLVERVITVTGAVKEPKNLLIKLGTPFNDLIEQCGGALGAVGKIISGGPMMGIAQSTDEVPVIKGTSGILVQLKEDIEKEKEQDCIRCGKCIEVCPMFLMPTMISRYSEKDMMDKAEEFNPLDCFECGACGYVCPSKIPLLKWIKKSKEDVIKKRKAQKK